MRTIMLPIAAMRCDAELTFHQTQIKLNYDQKSVALWISLCHVFRTIAKDAQSILVAA